MHNDIYSSHPWGLQHFYAKKSEHNVIFDVVEAQIFIYFRHFMYFSVFNEIFTLT